MKISIKIIIAVVVLILLILFGFWIYVDSKIIKDYWQEPVFNNSDKAHVCTTKEKQAQACTMQYDPVCGTKYDCGNETWCRENNVPCGVCFEERETYGNGCGACSAGVDSWTSGECISK